MLSIWTSLKICCVVTSYTMGCIVNDPIWTVILNFNCQGQGDRLTKMSALVPVVLLFVSACILFCTSLVFNGIVVSILHKCCILVHLFCFPVVFVCSISFTIGKQNCISLISVKSKTTQVQVLYVP